MRSARVSLAMLAMLGALALFRHYERRPVPSVTPSAVVAEDTGDVPSDPPLPERSLALTRATPPPSAVPDVLQKPASEDEYLHDLARLNLVDKSRALALARKGDEWYPSRGRGAEARKAMAVTLLVDLGHMDEARDETRRFIDAYPDSPYRTLAQGVTGIHPRPRGPEAPSLSATTPLRDYASRTNTK